MNLELSHPTGDLPEGETPNSTHADIIIVGTGIGGYETFRTLAKLLKRHRINKTILIIDQNNFFTFVPLLHEVATGAVEPTHASVPIRELIYGTPHRFLKARMERVNTEKKTITTDRGEVGYETCVIATGSTINYFNIPGAQEYTYHVRNLRDALTLQSAVLQRLESCEEHPLSITIVGGGFTGVEMAAEYAQVANHDFKKLYPNGRVTVTLVHGDAAILTTLPATVERHVSQRLAKLGVTILLNEKAVGVTKESLLLASGKTLPNDITVWTTGFATDAGGFVPASFVERGRMKVNHHLQSVCDTSVYALGDIAWISDPTHPEINYPQLGEAAHQEGIYAAKHIVATLEGRTLPPFRFRSKGTLIPVGEWYGVAIFSKHIILFGKLAWWMRRTAYMLFMPGFLRKVRLVTDWTLASFGFRHIIDLGVSNTVIPSEAEACLPVGRDPFQQLRRKIN